MKHIPLTVISLVLILCGCSNSPSERIVGKWMYIEDDTQFIEFFSDRTVSFGENDQIDLNGTWEILGDGRLLLEVKDGHQFQGVLKLSIDGDKMTTTTPKGTAMECIRVK